MLFTAATQDVDRLRQIAAFDESKKASLVLRAGDSGTLQDLSMNGNLIEPGQWVNPGQELARVAGQEKLKAVVRVPETQARDLLRGPGLLGVRIERNRFGLPDDARGNQQRNDDGGASRPKRRSHGT